MRIAAVFIVAAAMIVTAAAKDAPKAPPPAPDAEAVFHEIGLIGDWARDCSEPASPDNPHVNVSAPGAGLVLETNDVGRPFATNRYSVLTAKRIAADRVEVTVIFRPGTEDEERQTLVLLVRNGTRRTMLNRVEGGAFRVRHGIVLSTGQPTPVLRKCG